MTVKQLAAQAGLKILAGEGSLGREIESVYSCDLLSFVMGRAPADSALVTVMGNVNAMAVALLAVTVLRFRRLPPQNLLRPHLPCRTRRLPEIPPLLLPS